LEEFPLRKDSVLIYYLDVDGTIITNDHQEAFELNSFLKYLVRTGDVFWLTTHCRYADTSGVLIYLKPILSQENFLLASSFKPTTWNTLKTEVIDFTQPFIWFDDYLLEVEKKILKEKKCFENWIKMDLMENNQSIMKTVQPNFPDLLV
jgi:hypothetical protein